MKGLRNGQPQQRTLRESAVRLRSHPKRLMSPMTVLMFVADVEIGKRAFKISSRSCSLLGHMRRPAVWRKTTHAEYLVSKRRNFISSHCATQCAPPPVRLGGALTCCALALALAAWMLSFGMALTPGGTRVVQAHVPCSDPGFGGFDPRLILLTRVKSIYMNNAREMLPGMFSTCKRTTWNRSQHILMLVDVRMCYIQTKFTIHVLLLLGCIKHSNARAS